VNAPFSETSFHAGRSSFLCASVSLWFIAFFLSCSTTLAQGTKANPTAPPQEKIDAAALLKEILGSVPRDRSAMEGVLKIRAADGTQRDIPIKWSIHPLENEWQDIYQTPKDSPAPETLVIAHRPGSTNQYELRRGSAAAPETIQNPFVPFATSDFWLVDLGLEFYHWPAPKHLKTEMRKGRPCYVIESTNPGAANGPYARVLSWIDAENRGLIRAEAYDAKNKLLKEFEVKDIEKKDGRWQIKELVIRNDQADTRTRLIFNLEVRE
jgi:hypothetical protein